MHLIFVTHDVSKLDKSINSNSLQHWNIPSILVTLLVTNLFIPFISFNTVHLLKMHLILVTLEVSKLDKSINSNFLHD